MSDELKMGDRGNGVVVLNLQAMFGYTIDGMVGSGTRRLIDAQVDYGWDTRERKSRRWALRAQGLLDGRS